MYECVICQAINSSHRISCRCCGTIPTQYSPIAKPARLMSDWSRFVQVIPAIGCVRAAQHHQAKFKNHTVGIEYFAE
jgi:hypothetical protein